MGRDARRQCAGRRVSWLGGDDDLDEEYDESDIRMRPNPKANRPRTKRRPAHSDAQVARVVGVDRGRYTVLIDEDGDEAANLLSAVEAFEAAVAKRGGDSMTNAPDSNDPDYERYVVPRRKDDEGTRAYTARVLKAAQKLEA